MLLILSFAKSSNVSEPIFAHNRAAHYEAMSASSGGHAFSSIADVA